MPLKLNIGFSRKVGERDYGSRGASANLELELESGLVEAPDREAAIASTARPTASSPSPCSRSRRAPRG